jgi:hypothetical protein
MRKPVVITTDDLRRSLHQIADQAPPPPRALSTSAAPTNPPTECHAELARNQRWRRLAPVLAAVAVVAVGAGVLMAQHRSGGGGRATGVAIGASFEARPLLMPAQRVSAAQPDPFAGITFPLPSTEDGYSRLTMNEQKQLADAVRSVDCAHPPQLSDSPDRVVCDSTGSYASLLGPTIITATDVATAHPQPPSLPGSSQWTVAVALTNLGADTLHAWTSEHHSNNPSALVSPIQTTAAPPCGPIAATSCSDFIGIVIDDDVLSLSITLAPLSTALQIAGNFSQTTATQIAEDITH